MEGFKTITPAQEVEFDVVETEKRFKSSQYKISLKIPLKNT